MATIGSWTKLGAVVRNARKARNLSQADAAAQAGVSRSWLARVEAGHRGAELEPLLRLFSALELTLRLEDTRSAPQSTPSAPEHAAPDAEAAPATELAGRTEPAGPTPSAPSQDSSARVAAMQSSLDAALARFAAPAGDGPRSETLRRTLASIDTTKLNRTAQRAIEQAAHSTRKSDDGEGG
ncbi:helix-turn-helix domain-containing protein [Nocardioides dubius]|uniref:HTH cro/C1-type domain-containing protein n=1 Tax=Nocardioides dubius TaxID=317019 RepID=A0ABN1U0R5_9ACTN